MKKLNHREIKAVSRRLQRKMMLLLAISLLSFIVESRAEPPTTIILVRHAERPPGTNPSLSSVGLQRALRLREILRDTKLSAVFATQYCRTIQTAQPIALRIGVNVQIYATTSQNVDFSSCYPAIEVASEVHPLRTTHARDLAETILRDYSGKTVLVAGHSDTVPALIAELGGPDLCPEPYPIVDGECHISSDEHDNLFIVTVTQEGAALLRLRY